MANRARAPAVPAAPAAPAAPAVQQTMWPEKFNGTPGEDVDAWIQNFRDCIQYNRWTADDALVVLGNKTGESAATWLRNYKA